MTATVLVDEDRDVARAPGPPPYRLEPSAPQRPWWWAWDRTAVLTLGIVAGFLLGLSFNAAGRAATWAALFPDAAAPAAPAPAQPLAAIPEPQAPGAIDPRVIRRVAADGSVRVGVFGDSFGDGVWAGLYHQLPEKRGFQIFRFGKEATGFTRYKTLNLEDRARAQVAHQPIDVAVISFGANDVQPIFEEGHLQPLMSPGWQRIIGARVDRFVAVTRSTGASVYWVGLPVMRDAVMDANVTAMNAFFAGRMRALGVPFLETRSRSVDPAGRYADYLPDSATGAPVPMRKQDGVHMTMQGYDRLTAPLAATLRNWATATAARRQAAAGGHPSPALLAAIQAPRAKPKPSATPTPTPHATDR